MKTAVYSVRDRCVLIGATSHCVDFVNSALEAWLRRTKIQRFDSKTGKESWFYLYSPAQMRGFIAHSETVLQGNWYGTGWYRTRIRRSRDEKWLVLDRGDIFAALAARFTMSDHEQARFNVFIKQLDTDRGGE